MSLPHELLGVAAHLAARETRRPRQATLRRSVSTSYYALFHLLTSEATAIVGANLTEAAGFRVQRWFDHSEMKKVAGMFSALTPPRAIQPILNSTVSPDLQAVSQAFIRLQEARHEADYDLSSWWTRLNAQQHVQIAQTAFSAWNRIRRTHEANVFALAMLSPKLFERER